MAVRAAREGFPEYCIAVDDHYSLEWFHQKIALRLEQAVKQVENGEDIRLMVFMPPRHGKSDQVTQKFPSWVLGQHPDWPIIVSSYSQELATDFGQGTRDLMDSVPYSAIFDTKLRADTSAKARWMTDGGGGYTAVGVGGAITGRGFKIGLVDDPFKNREEADSAVTRESVWKWWRSTFYTRQEGKTVIVVILTRWHDDDLAGRLLKEQAENEKNGIEHYDKWEILEFKAIAEEDEEFRKKGEALWPDKFDEKKLAITRAAIGSYEWSALYQQNPIDVESQEFKKDWLRYRTWSEIAKLPLRKFATIDPAGSKKKESDNTGVTRNYVTLQNEWNIKSRRYRINAKGIIDLIFQLHDEGMEKIGIEEGVYSDAIEPFLKEKMDELNIYPNVVPLKHRGIMKETRIRGLIPRYENSKIFHIEGECLDLEEEYLRFPKCAHDDCLDTTAYQNQIALPPSSSIGDLVTDEEMNGCLVKGINTQEGRWLIGVSSSMPVHYVIGNKEGLFFQDVTENPLKDIGAHLEKNKDCRVLSDMVGDVEWLKILQQKHRGSVLTCALGTDKEEMIKWTDNNGVIVSKSKTIQHTLDEIRGGRFPIFGSEADWKSVFDEWVTLYRSWETNALGEREASWESNTPQKYIRAVLFYRVLFDRFGSDGPTFIPAKQDVLLPKVERGTTMDGMMPARRLIPKGYHEVNF